MEGKKRKKVALDTETLAILQIQAEKQGRKLKNYMKYVLREKAKSFISTQTLPHKKSSSIS